MKKSEKQGLVVAGGLAALAAAATGVYFMTGKHAKNRKKAAKWLGDMQNDVVNELGKAGKASQATYDKVIDTVAKNYSGLKNVSTTELAVAAAELKSNWDAIKSQMDGAITTVRRVSPTSVRTKAQKVAVKKAVSKAPAKKTAAKQPAKKAAAKKR